MGKQASIQWTKLLLSLVLLFGTMLPTVSAQTVNLNGIVASVEDETGKSLQDGTVQLLEYNFYSYTGESGNIVQYNYPRLSFQTSLNGGGLFIPNAYVLKGKMYELFVSGKSSAGKNIVYHYSFKGGEIDQLQFTKDRLKELNFAHDKLGVQGNLLLVAKNALESDSEGYFFPYQAQFNDQGQASVLAASNTPFQAYASLNDTKNSVSFLLTKLVPADVPSGQTVRFDGEVVKVTPPNGYGSAKINVGMNNAGTYNGAATAYVTKGAAGRVDFTIKDASGYEYSFSRDKVTFNQDLAIELDPVFSGEAYTGYSMKQVQPNVPPQTQFYANTLYKDSKGNRLYYIYKSGAAAVSRTGYWVESFDQDGRPVRYDMESTSKGVIYTAAANPQASASANGLLQYEVYDESGKLVQTYTTDNIGWVELTNLLPGTYRLKLAKQLFPTTVVTLSLDKKITVMQGQGSGEAAKNLAVTMPAGYTLVGYLSGMIWEMSGDNVVSGYSPSFNTAASSLQFYYRIVPERSYILYAALWVKDAQGAEGTYYVQRNYTGQELQDTDNVPVEPKLAKSVFSLTGAPVKANPAVSITTAEQTKQSKFIAPVRMNPTAASSAVSGFLLGKPGNYTASLTGTDGDVSAYYLSKTITLPDTEQPINVTFADAADRLVPVELQNNGKIVPFASVNVAGDNYYTNYYATYNTGTAANALSKLYTTPGVQQFNFTLNSGTVTNETPWRYTWVSDRKDIQSAAVFSFDGQIQNPAFDRVTQTVSPYDGKKYIYTSVNVKSGDLKLSEVFVQRESKYGSSAVIGTKPYDAQFDVYTNVTATVTLTDQNGNIVHRNDENSLSNIYVSHDLVPGTYTLTVTQPVGLGKEISVSQPVVVGDNNGVPGKPQVLAAYTGQDLQITWHAVAGADYYQVFAGEQNGSLSKVADQLKDTSYTLSKPKVGAAYDIKVAAVGKNGQTESDVIHYTVSDLAATKLEVSTDTSAAGHLKLGGKLGIALTGSSGKDITAKAEVAYTQGGASLSKEIALAYQAESGKYTGDFTIEEGMTDVASVKASLLRNDQNSGSLTKDLNKKVGATVLGKIVRSGQAVNGGKLQLVTGSEYVGTDIQADGTFVLYGIAGGTGRISVITGNEAFYNVFNNVKTEYGKKLDLGSISLPILKDVKVRLIENDTAQPVSKALRVSIYGVESDGSNKEVQKFGQSGADGYFATYSGETELKKLKPGTYEAVVSGQGIYDDTTQRFTIQSETDYTANPVQVKVAKKTKDTTNVSVKLFIPDGRTVSSVDYFSLYSNSVSQAFGFEAGYFYEYNRNLTVSERVYAPNPEHVLGGGSSTTVAQYVYGRYGEFVLNNVIMAKDYQFSANVKGYQAVQKQQQISAVKTLIEAPLNLGVTVTGRLVPPNGKSLTKAEISAYGGSSYAYVNAESDGSFSLQGLSGKDDLHVRINAIGYLPIELTLKPGDAQALGDIVLQTDQYVHGKVFDTDGKTPLVHAYVYAYDKASGAYKSWARTDGSGYFKIRGLSAGDYRLEISMYGYPSMSQNVSAGPDEVTIILQQQNNGSFSGAGNSFDASVSTVVYGKDLQYRLNYKNNGSTDAKNVKLNVSLPNALKFVPNSALLGKNKADIGGASFIVPVGDVKAGESGAFSFKTNVAEAVDTIRATARIDSDAIQGPVMTATTNVLFVTLNAPSVTGEKKIKVYGNAKPGSIVEVFAGDLSVAKVKAEGRWWFADVLLPLKESQTTGEFDLVARVTEGTNGSSLSQTSETVKVQYKADSPRVEDVTITAGWNVNVKLNPYTSVASFAVTEKTPIQTKVVFKEALDEASISFIGTTYPLKRSSDGKTFTGEVPYGWSSYGEQLLELTFKKGDTTITLPLMEVIVLIDPSGYVFEGSMDNRVAGVTSIVQQMDESTSRWSDWDAQLYGQVNPQVTDEQGRYGWDVLQGKWRVQFSKQGYEDYTSRIVVVPPAETQLNVPIVRSTAPSIIKVTPDNQAQQVDVNAEIKLEFDRPMMEAGMKDKIRLVQDGTDIAIEGAFTFEGMKGYSEKPGSLDAALQDGKGQNGWFVEDAGKLLSRTVGFKPSIPLRAGTSYKLLVDQSTIDYDGKTLLQSAEYTFMTRRKSDDIPTPTPTGGGGAVGGAVGGAGAPSAATAGSEVVLDAAKLSELITGNTATIVLSKDQNSLVVSNQVWKELQSKGITLKLQREEATLAVSPKAFALQEQESLNLQLKASNAGSASGYQAASAQITVELFKLTGDQKQALTASVPLQLTMTAKALDNPEFIGLYEYVSGSPVYSGRALTANMTVSGTYGLFVFERPFTDVDGHWANNDIRYLVSHHIVDGVTEQSFAPGAATTRAQIAKLFAEMLQLNTSGSGSSFADVDASAWYAASIAAVEKAGIFQGAGGQFRPNDAISRQELAVVISRLIKNQEMPADSAFADQAKIADWAQSGVKAAVKFGIIQGNEQNQFQPDTNATRAEAAAMIHRLIKALDAQPQQ